MSGITKRSFANSRAVQLISANIRKCDRVDAGCWPASHALTQSSSPRSGIAIITAIRDKRAETTCGHFRWAGKASKFPANYRMPRLDKVGFHCRSMAPKGATAAVPVFHFPACQLLSAKLQKISGSARL